MRLPRFRLRTLMVAVAAVAVVLGAIRGWGRIRQQGFFYEFAAGLHAYVAAYHRGETEWLIVLQR